MPVVWWGIYGHWLMLVVLGVVPWSPCGEWYFSLYWGHPAWCVCVACYHGWSASCGCIFGGLDLLRCVFGAACDLCPTIGAVFFHYFPGVYDLVSF